MFEFLQKDWLFHDESSPLTRRDEHSSDMKWDLGTDNVYKLVFRYGRKRTMDSSKLK